MPGWTNLTPSAAALASGNAYLYEQSGALKFQGTSGSAVTLANADGTQPTVLDEVIPTDPSGAYFDGTGLRLFGVSGNYATTPDSAALDITGDFDARVNVTLTDWTPAIPAILFGKSGAAGQRSYYAQVLQNGRLSISWSEDGTNYITANSTVAPTVSDGANLWLRFVIDVDNGGNYNVLFYTGTDGTTWTQLGTTVVGVGTTSIFASTATLFLGTADAGSSLVNGTIQRIQLRNGIAGTIAFDADFSAVPADSFAFSESSSNAATVTLTTTRYSFGIPGSNLYSATTATMGLNTTWYTPIKIAGKSMSIKHVAFEVTTAPTATATARIGIYVADSNMQPTGAPIWVSGAVSVSSTAAAIYRIRVTPFTLTSGNYVIMFNLGGTANCQMRFYIGATQFVANTLGNGQLYRFTATETLSGDFGNPGTKWNTRTSATAGFYNPVLLGW